MAISRGGHLFGASVLLLVVLVVVVVVAHAYDFTSSRQFRKNLAVSRYRNNTFWLPNYTWRPPEKYYGPRKKPAWEKVEDVEEERDKRKDKKLKEWEEKMREISRKEREKWKTYNKAATSMTSGYRESKRDDLSKRSEESVTSSVTSAEYVANSEDEPGSESLDNIDKPVSRSDVRSGSNAISGSSDEEYGRRTTSEFEAFAKRDQQSKRLKQPIFSDKIVRPLVPERRMYQSKKFQNDDLHAVANTPSQEKLKFVKGRREKSTAKTPASEKGMKDVRRKEKNNSTDENNPQREKKRNLVFPKNRWGMSHKKPPSIFLKDMSKKSKDRERIDENESHSKDPTTPGNNLQTGRKKQRKANVNTFATSSKPRKAKMAQKNVNLKPKERPASLRNQSHKTVSDRKISQTHKRQKQGTRKDTKFVNKDEPFRSNRWGMSVTSVPRRFLQDISHGSNRQHSEADRLDAYGNSRWGMSVTSPPRLFAQDISRRSKSGPNANTPPATGNTRWGMSVSTPPQKFFEDISARRRTQKAYPSLQEVSTEFEAVGELPLGPMKNVDATQDAMSRRKHQRHQDFAAGMDFAERMRGDEIGDRVKEDYANMEVLAGQIPEEDARAEHGQVRNRIGPSTEESEVQKDLFRNGRWGMSVTVPPEQFLTQLSRRSNRKLTSDFARPEKFGASRWGMSISEPPDKFLQEISRSRRMEDHQLPKSSSTAGLISAPDDYRDGDAHYTNPGTTNVPDLPRKHAGTTDNALEAKSEVCKNYLEKGNVLGSDVGSIPKICEDSKMERNSVEKVSMNSPVGYLKKTLANRPWADEDGKVTVDNVYVQRGLSLLLGMMQQTADSSSNFINVPIICRIERVPVQSQPS